VATIPTLSEEPKLTLKQALERLHSVAKVVINEEPEHHWLPFLRNHAAQLGADLDVKDDNLLDIITEVQRVDAPCNVYRKGDRFTAKPATFLVDGLIRANSANVIVGQPKVGKSTLALALAKALHDRDETFLGRTISHPAEPMPVLVFGTDQGEEDWIPYLQTFSLMNEQQEMLGSLEFFVSVDAQQEYNFTRAGVARMRAEVIKHPNALVIIDSLSSMMEPLGMDENLSQYSGPIRHALKELTTAGATVVVLHHTTKRVICWDWIEACRGSSSISSVFSWGVLARWLVADNDTGVRTDTRVGITAKGRGQSPTGGILAQYLQGVGWGLCGSLAEAQKLQHAREAWAALPRVEASLFEALENQAVMGRLEISNAELASQLNMTSSNTARAASALVSRGLIRLTRPGKPYWWGLTEVSVMLLDRVADFIEPLSDSVDSSDSPDSAGTDSGAPQGSAGSPSPECDSANLVILDPKNQKNQKIQHSVGGQPSNPESLALPPVNTPLELLFDGVWSNGWKLHQDTSGPHQVAAWTQIARQLHVKHRLRWGVDVRLCQPSPSFDDLDW
jgi:hypothetical protein